MYVFSVILLCHISGSSFNFLMKSIIPTTVTNKANAIEPIIIKMSTALSHFVVAHTFRWKRGGSMNAIGTAVRAEAISRSSEMLSYIPTVSTQVAKTTTDRERFFPHFLLPDFDQPLKI